MEARVWRGVGTLPDLRHQARVSKGGDGSMKEPTASSRSRGH